MPSQLISTNPERHSMSEKSTWVDKANGLRLPFEMWIDNAPVTSGAAGDKELVSPRDGAVLGRLPLADADEVDAAVRTARAAFDDGDWSRRQPRDRGAVLQRWADIVDANRDELALLISLEMGKPITVAREVEAAAAINALRWYGELADKLMDESPRGRPDSLAVIAREPVGVVGAITPWNMPITLLTWKLAPALVAGNSVVVKPAALSPLSAVALARWGAEAGLPAGVLQIVQGSGPVAGAALALHDDVATLTFTGSPAVGKQLQRYAADSNAKPVWLELGGKTPFVVLEDADLDAATDMLAWGITFNSGQLCTAAARAIVAAPVHDEVVAAVLDKIDKRPLGDPLDPDTLVGPLVSRSHRSDVLGHIGRGVEQGATLVRGDVCAPSGPGSYLEPAVFTEVDPGSDLAQQEIFGPVLSVIRADDPEHAVALANDSSFGLGASLWTRDISSAHRISRRIEAGSVWVNCFEEGDLSVPFGGRKLSGHGADKSAHALDKFTHLKTTWIQL